MFITGLTNSDMSNAGSIVAVVIVGSECSTSISWHVLRHVSEQHNISNKRQKELTASI